MHRIGALRIAAEQLPAVYTEVRGMIGIVYGCYLLGSHRWHSGPDKDFTSLFYHQKIIGAESVGFYFVTN